MLRATDRGLYCEAGDFHVDPWAPVPRAVVTHAHGDHLTWGCDSYLVATEGAGVAATRLGDWARGLSSIPYGEVRNINGVSVSLHPAGHIIGSAQVRLEYRGEVWVVSGDYKTDPDSTCAPWEPVRCHTFITESTFGLPLYRWPSQQRVFDDINDWWRTNAADGRASFLYGYALGKAQRLIAGLDASIGPILTHGAVERLTRVYREAGVVLPPTSYATAQKGGNAGAMIVAPPSAAGSTWARKFGPSESAFASGWMRVRGARRRRGVDRGFTLSDHVDWPQLLSAVDATGAERVWVTHGFTGPVVRWFQERGLDAMAIATRYEGERDDTAVDVIDNPDEISSTEIADGASDSSHDANDGKVGVKRFAALYDAIDATTGTQKKVAALAAYFRDAPPADAAWAVAFLTGRRPRRLVRAPDLRMWAAAAADIPDWLFDESYAQAGDLAETISLLLPENSEDDERPFAWWVEEKLLPLPTLEPVQQRAELHAAWAALCGTSRFLYIKLLTGAFRVGVSDGLVVRALASASGIEAETIAHRMMGQWEPSASWFTQLIGTETTDADWSRPYPFYLAYALEQPIESIGDREEWQAEWKWDGIRAQLVKRRGRVFLWSRGEELLAGRFPEVEAAAEWIPDGTVLDGELLAWRGDAPLPFAELQKRINRKSVGKKLLSDVPGHMLVYDCLEYDGSDIRALPLDERRIRAVRIVDALPGGAAMGLSPVVPSSSWEDLAAARTSSRLRNAEGLMLKRRNSPYGVGRRVGDWYKWKVDPLTVDAVLVYAQSGSGRRAGLFTDYTFAVWDGDALVPFAKAYSGLTDAEIREVDRFVRRNTLEKFGPVRTVKPELVFELAFEGIQASTRHKSGIAVRFPRISRWRTDKPATEADTLETVRGLLRAYGVTANGDA